MAGALKASKSGTAVLWQHLDRITGRDDGDAESLGDAFNEKFSSTVLPHLEMTFHRFLFGPKRIHLMVGRKLQESSPNEVAETNQELLRIADLSTSTKLSGIELSLNKGEILGIAGLVGAGRSELARAVFGIDPIDSGEIYIGGTQVRIRSPRDAIKAGIGFVPENRKTSCKTMAIFFLK